MQLTFTLHPHYIHTPILTLNAQMAPYSHGFVSVTPVELYRPGTR